MPPLSPRPVRESSRRAAGVKCGAPVARLCSAKEQAGWVTTGLSSCGDGMEVAETIAAAVAADFPAGRGHAARDGRRPGASAGHRVRHRGRWDDRHVRSPPSAAAAGANRALRDRGLPAEMAAGNQTGGGRRSVSCLRAASRRLNAVPAPDGRAPRLCGAVLPIPEVRSAVPAAPGRIPGNGRVIPCDRRSSCGAFRKSARGPRRGDHQGGGLPHDGHRGDAAARGGGHHHDGHREDAAVRDGGRHHGGHPGAAAQDGGRHHGGHPAAVAQGGGDRHDGHPAAAARGGGRRRGGPRDSRAACHHHGAAGLAIGNSRHP